MESNRLTHRQNSSGALYTGLPTKLFPNKVQNKSQSTFRAKKELRKPFKINGLRSLVRCGKWDLKISAHFLRLIEMCRKARKYGISEQHTKIRLRCFSLSFCTLSGQNHTKILHVPLMILQLYDIGTTKRIEDICTLGFLLFDLHDYLNGRSPPRSDRIFGLMEDLIYAVR